ncbi:cation diffusion facilitator family transporter [Thermosynechococcaceae cyanobacterium BACA0444]|uniref:Cation diffusion facilitator family transporter n=1 Tax=Pseudocalidococcus azoricus BACA0444 TaxID=2918990 RepID=A0AAE4FQM6_9CYAN|nr:cation diffusion facilitator family transporter [Pseudocalidococcus azoricus]MDS3860375.1 cation diffusion facilitator family transporter [Pseudocalidococcus azoricus BACA0444]
MSHSHHHPHGHSHTPKQFTQAFRIGLTLNISLVVLEVVAGLWSNSLALLSDAGHNLSDVLGLVLAWGASYLTRRQTSAQKTYGWRKASILAALFNAIFLMVVTGGLAWEALKRLMNPGPVEEMTVIWVASLALVINGGTAWLFAAGRKGDLNIRGAFLHMMSDALVSLGVIVAAVLILLTGWFWLDPLVTLLIGILIIYTTWDLLRDALTLSLDGVPKSIDTQAVRDYLNHRPGVGQIHDLHIWAMSTTETALTAHLVMESGYPGDDFLHQTTAELQAHFGINHATLQIEVGDSPQACVLIHDPHGY